MAADPMGPVLEIAVGIVADYSDTRVSLRQLLYQLVAWQTCPTPAGPTRACQEKTAEGRRDGTFPDLLDLVPAGRGAGCWESREALLRTGALELSARPQA